MLRYAIVARPCFSYAKACKDDKSYVRIAQLYLGCSDPTKLISRMLVRPIDKIALLLNSDEEARSPTEELS